jgi:hypothetical protein
MTAELGELGLDGCIPITFVGRSAIGTSKICAIGPEPGNIETFLKKDKRLWRQPAKTSPVTRQEIPAAWLPVGSFWLLREAEKTDDACLSTLYER